MKPQLYLTNDTQEGVPVTILFDDRDFIAKRYAGGSAPQLRKVFECTASDVQPDVEILEACFEEFNIGEGPVAQAYRARGLRSLSVGDVIVLRGTAWVCQSSGWKDYPLPLNPSERKT